jgi:hypothetical protein
MSQLIRVIWNHCLAAWLDRNLACHGADAEHCKEIAPAQVKEKDESLLVRSTPPFVLP